MSQGIAQLRDLYGRAFALYSSLQGCTTLAVLQAKNRDQNRDQNEFSALAKDLEALLALHH